MGAWRVVPGGWTLEDGALEGEALKGGALEGGPWEVGSRRWYSGR